jgi:hypothetical protein
MYISQLVKGISILVFFICNPVSLHSNLDVSTSSFHTFHLCSNISSLQTLSLVLSGGRATMPSHTQGDLVHTSLVSESIQVTCCFTTKPHPSWTTLSKVLHSPSCCMAPTCAHPCWHPPSPFHMWGLHHPSSVQMGDAGWHVKVHPTPPFAPCPCSVKQNRASTGHPCPNRSQKCRHMAPPLPLVSHSCMHTSRAHNWGGGGGGGDGPHIPPLPCLVCVKQGTGAGTEVVQRSPPSICVWGCHRSGPPLPIHPAPMHTQRGCMNVAVHNPRTSHKLGRGGGHCAGVH